ncbi:J domain-containing protein [Neobacillus piezotolerans]|uniref:J domain-containing protein n=1 Tax=Neobacillus piezotolerans TaxID=2259171 RepID=UPI0015F140D7|nr:J domain-containing protein [Neobacillus piezotolerans]
MQDNFYSVLGLTEECAPNEIRKAYIKKIREYPIEKYPEEFKKIRKAYEILSDPDSRKEYDTMSKYGDEIRQLEAEGFSAMDEEDFQKAITSFKKILIIEPSLHNIRNQLGLALCYDGELDKAIAQFRKLIEMQPENAVYQSNLAFACEKSGFVEEAVFHLNEAFRLDPNDINIMYSLYELHIRNEQYSQARNAIENAILSKDNEGFHKFYYLFKLVEIDIHERDKSSIERSFARIEELLENHPEEKAYVAREYAKLAYELNEVMMYDWSKRLTERAIQLDPSNEDIGELHNYTSGNEELIRENNSLSKDQKVLDPLRHAAGLYIYGSSMDEAEFDESVEVMLHNCRYIAKNQPEETISSIKRLMIKYPAIYEARKDLFSDVMDQAMVSKREHEQYDQMKNDSLITNSLKRLIALYLSDFEQDERERYFDDILDEMSYEQPNKVKQGIDRLKQKYPDLYELNPNFLSEIKKKLNDARPSSNTSSYNTSSQSSNSSSCFVATAAFGSPLAMELDSLRFWRDVYLKKTLAGRLFVRFYYKVGPFAAGLVKRSPLMKVLVRKIVWRILEKLEAKYSINTNLALKRKGDINRWKNV